MTTTQTLKTPTVGEREDRISKTDLQTILDFASVRDLDKGRVMDLVEFILSLTQPTASVESELKSWEEVLKEENLKASNRIEELEAENARWKTWAAHIEKSVRADGIDFDKYQTEGT